MSQSYTELAPADFPAHGLSWLEEIPQPPSQLWLTGTPPPPHLTLLAVVGSRAHTSYGRQVVNELIEGLAPYPVGIVSGLARGMDALAHQAALRAGLYTLAIPGSGLDRSVLYPAQNRGLADDIVAAGGGLLSELPPTTRAARWTFPQRNRLMAGLTRGTLLIEANERSGTLITARMAVDYNRELLVVPGSIFSPQSRGTHQFLKLGAIPVTSSADIVEALHLPTDDPSHPPTSTSANHSELEQLLLSHLDQPNDIDTLVRNTGCSAADVSAALMGLEINGHVRVIDGLYQAKV